MLSFPLHARKGSSAVNVVHTRAQKFCNFQGSCGACEGSKCCNFQGLNINSQDFPHARAQNALLSKVLCLQGLKTQLFRESFVHAGTQSASISRILRFSRFCACRAPYTAISWDFVHAGARRASLSRAVCTKRAPNAARSASLSRDFVHARVPHASFFCLENCQIIGHQKQHKMITEICKKCLEPL